MLSPGQNERNQQECNEYTERLDDFYINKLKNNEKNRALCIYSRSYVLEIIKKEYDRLRNSSLKF